MIYIYIHTHTYIHICTHTHTHTRVHTSRIRWTVVDWNIVCLFCRPPHASHSLLLRSEWSLHACMYVCLYLNMCILSSSTRVTLTTAALGMEPARMHVCMWICILVMIIHTLHTYVCVCIYACMFLSLMYICHPPHACMCIHVRFILVYTPTHIHIHSYVHLHT